MLLVLGGLLLSRAFLGESSGAPSDNSKYVPPKYFQGWGKAQGGADPELVVVVSGQAHNYLQPCGCSSPQFGGLVRRYNFIESLRERGWKVLPIEVGDLGPKKDQNPVHFKPIMPAEQTFLKYKTMLRSLHEMGFRTFGLGEYDFHLDLLTTLAKLNLNNEKNLPTPLCLTLDDSDGVFKALGAKASEILQVEGATRKFRVGISSALGHAAQQHFVKVPNLSFKDNALAIPAEMKALHDAGVNLNILIYQGTEKDAMAAAKWCWDLSKNGVIPAKSNGQIVQQPAKTAPIDIMLAADPQLDEPPALPSYADKVPTPIYTVGHKGKYVGVIGFFKKNDGTYEQKYELVKIGPEFDTPKEKEAAHPVMKLMEEYTAAVAKQQLIKDFSRTSHPSAVKAKGMMIDGNPVNVYYAGSERCADCHEKEHQIWSTATGEKYGHHHAFATLEEVKKPSLRHFDGECIVCHTVGFEYKGGYLDSLGLNPNDPADAKKLARHNERLKNVGCESCHGPAGMHADNPNATQLYELINPYRPTAAELDPKEPLAKRTELWKRRMEKIDINMCQKCHDIENAVHWNEVDFTVHWFKVAHPKPRPGIQDAHGRPIAGEGAVAPPAAPGTPPALKLPSGNPRVPNVSPPPTE
jgi:hypothetical protein